MTKHFYPPAFLVFVAYCCLAGLLLGNRVVNRSTAVYVPNTALWNSSPDSFFFDGAMTGMADGQIFSFSVWYRDDGGDGTTRTIHEWSSAGTRKLSLSHTSTNFIRVEGRNSALTTVLDVRSTNTITTSSGWVRISGCFNLSNTSLRKLYFGTTAETLVVTTYNTAETIDFLSDSSPRFTVFANGNLAGDMNGALAEFWWGLVYLDDPSKFQSGIYPISLGVNGELPTGSSPVIYLKDAGDSFGVNYGTGQDLGLQSTGAFGTTTPPP